MAIKYFVEADEDLEMDVQVGPEEEIEAAPDDKASEIADPVVPEVKEEEGVQLNPVEIAKKSPETVCVGCKIENVDDKEIREFYVDARDVEKYADLNEKSFLESLNDIILANEGSGMGADNIVVVMDESTSCYTRTLEKNGAACVFVNEAVEDIEMDVQVGPDKEEESVKADPQEANPVDAVKRQYGSVVVANQGDEFFMDVEDVQKCAELNCESVIKTLNKIIDVNENFDMNTENIRIICKEYYDFDVLAKLEEAGVVCVDEAGATIKDLSGIEGFCRTMKEVCETIAGRFKGQKDIKSTAIQNSLDRLNKQIARYEEEYEMSKKPGFEPKFKWAVKSLLAAAPALVSSYVMSGVQAAGNIKLAKGYKDIGLMSDSDVKKTIAATILGTAGGAVAGAALSGVINAVAYRREVEFLLHTLKAQKGVLESRLKAAKDRESEGKNTILV